MLNTFVFYAARKYQESTILVPKGEMHEELRSIVILKVKKCFESNESSCESGYSKNNQSYNAQGTFILKLVQSALQSSFARFV